jgi:hypothetical protein
VSQARGGGERSPTSGGEWALIALWGITLASYPFFIKYLSHSSYQVAFGILLLLAILLLLRDAHLRISRHEILNQEWLLIAAGFYGLYVLLLGMASLVNLGPAYQVSEFGRVITKALIASMLFAFLSLGAYRWTLDRYADVMVFVSFLGIVLVVLVALGKLSPIGTMVLPATGVRDTGIRDVYPLGFAWGRLPLPGGRGLIRLQSFADEPGTFAFALLIAIIWDIFRRKWARVGLMGAALVLTWSVGALLAALLAVFAWTIKSRSWLAVSLVLVGGVVSFMILRTLNTEYSGAIGSYLSSKLGVSEGTSLGDRLTDASVLMSRLESAPLGLGGGALANEVGVSLGVGWLRALAEAGILGFSAYLVAFGLLTAVAMRSGTGQMGEAAALGLMVIALAFAALQRARMDESVWHWWIIMGFVRFYCYSQNAPEYGAIHPFISNDTGRG